jgi:hypothetical protein
MNEIIDELLIELNKVKSFKLNYNRPNASGIRRIVQHGRDKELNRQHTYGVGCQSIQFGFKKQRFKKNAGLIESIWNNRYPEIYQKLLELGSYLIQDDFEFQKNNSLMNITLNKNFKTIPHYDANKSDSIIIGIGNYSRGRLVLYDQNDNIEYVDIKNKPFQFNGFETKHGTEDFDGDRYSIIYYLD